MPFLLNPYRFGPPPVVTDFTSLWKTDNSGTSNNDQVTIPVVSGGLYDATTTVDWGDGNIDTNMSTNTDPRWTHTYTVAGTYTIKITGTFEGWAFGGLADSPKILNISNWGGLKLGNNSGYFYGCSNLTITATDELDLSGTTILARAFRGCSSLTYVGGLELSSFATITQVQSMFFGCTLYNQHLPNLSANSITRMSSMYISCPSFNQPVNHYKTDLVERFDSMFSGCTAFDQDISGFNISSSTNLATMLSGSGFSITNYDLLLDPTTGWPSQATIQPSMNFHAGTAHYSAGAPTTGRAVLTGAPNNWTITDGGTP